MLLIIRKLCYIFSLFCCTFMFHLSFIILYFLHKRIISSNSKIVTKDTFQFWTIKSNRSNYVKIITKKTLCFKQKFDKILVQSNILRFLFNIPLKTEYLLMFCSIYLTFLSPSVENYFQWRTIPSLCHTCIFRLREV